MSNPGEFQGEFDFAFGDVRGVRVWKVLGANADPGDWRLRSVYFPYFWTEGVNEAECAAVPGGSVRTLHCQTYHDHTEWPLRGDNPECFADHLPDLQVDPNHDCGFYAYTATTDNRHLATNGPSVLGAVQGFGRVVIGSKGFRASRARILGLVLPYVLKNPEKQIRQPAWDGVDDALRAAYPNTPIFGSLDDLLDAFPLTHPEGATA